MDAVHLNRVVGWLVHIHRVAVGGVHVKNSADPLDSLQGRTGMCINLPQGIVFVCPFCGEGELLHCCRGRIGKALDAEFHSRACVDIGTREHASDGDDVTSRGLDGSERVITVGSASESKGAARRRHSYVGRHGDYQGTGVRDRVGCFESKAIAGAC